MATNPLHAARRYRHRTLRAGVREYQRKLIAAKPGSGIRFAGALANDLRDFHQDTATDQMPALVVDSFEIVHVGKHTRQRLSAPHAAFVLASQRLSEISQVIQPRQVVGDRQFFRPRQSLRTVERDRPRLQHFEHVLPEPVRQLGHLSRGLSVDRDQSGHRLPTAHKREPHRGDRGRTRGRRILQEIP